MIAQLDTENADLDLTSLVTVLTHTPDASLPRLCQALVYLGDGSQNLDGTGGTFTLEINLAAQSGWRREIGFVAATTRAALLSEVFPVPANTQVTVRVLSPNGADTDVDVTAYLLALATTVTAATVSDKTGYSLAAAGLDAISTTAPAGVASNFREMLVQTWRRLFKRATMTGSELRCYADDGTTVVTTQALADDGTTQTQGAAS
jgi:hypothetical protein